MGLKCEKQIEVKAGKIIKLKGSQIKKKKKEINETNDVHYRCWVVFVNTNLKMGLNIIHRTLLFC